jgi:hypothetical protein
MRAAGAGLGGSTQFFLDATPAAKVFAIDLWHQEYCVDVLETASHVPASTVELYRNLPGLYETFCANVWDRKNRITPYRLPAIDAVKALSHMSILPQLIYIDADLSYERLKAFLDFMFTEWVWSSVGTLCLRFPGHVHCGVSVARS